MRKFVWVWCLVIWVLWLVWPISTPHPAYVTISLLRRQPKFQLHQAELRRLGLRTTWFPAVDGSTLDLAATESYLRPDYLKYLSTHPSSLGHLGAACSHMAVWRGVGEGVTVVLEDDVILSSSFSEKARRSIRHANSHTPGWDMLLFGFCCDYDHNTNCHLNDGESVRLNTVTVRQWTGLWAYAINGKRGAAALLSSVLPLEWHIDHALSNRAQTGKISVVGCMPPIAYHPGKMSISSWNYESHWDYTGYISDTNTHYEVASTHTDQEGV